MRLTNCCLCSLSETRTQVVCGRGNIKARIMLCGEAPGATEDREGKPFIGDAGKVLDKFLKKARLNRKDLYITNIVKCQPPKRDGSHKPLYEEMVKCSRWLAREIEIIKPLLIVAFGATALESLCDIIGVNTVLSSVIYSVKFNMPVFVTFHPASILYVPQRSKKFYDSADELRKYIDKEKII